MNRLAVSNTLDDLDTLVRSRTILRHPFYVAWERGELTRAQLATYARAYYPHVQAFPGYLRSAIDCADDPDTRADLTRNLTDELSDPKSHLELWLDFAEELGVDRSDLAALPTNDSSRATVETFGRLTCHSITSALTALYSYESQQPEVSCRKMAGLREFYGVHSRKGLAYFDVHATTDIRHRQCERLALARSLDSEASRDEVVGAATDALDAYWGLLDGVCDAAGVSGSDASAVC